jgi:hypothetical protein
MSSIIIRFEPDVTAVWTDTSPTDRLEIDGEEFSLVGPPSDQLIFYDWLRDSSGRVVGMELHAFIDDMSWLPVRSNNLVATGSEFPRLLFRQSPSAIGRGEEAFGDLTFYCDRKGQLLLHVGLEQWLSVEEISELRSSIASNP